jgi:HAD superfamily hydrolase (TIGR01459 family)
MNQMMQTLSGITPLIDQYDGWIIDLWGTMHDGIALFPGSVDALRSLRAAGKRVVFLSNAPRPANIVHEQLRNMGITDDLHDGVMTSGEVTRRLLLDRDKIELREQHPWLSTLGDQVLHIGGNHDLALFEELGLTLTNDPAQASFLMNTGPDERRGKSDPAGYNDILDAACAHGLPMICPNPDMEAIRGGVRLICAGLLARIYEQKGGTAHWIGKPFAGVYTSVLELIGLPAEKCIAVGDALATDILGAQNAGISSLWVLGGIHGEKLGDDPELANAEVKAAGLSPVATIPMFRP